MAINWTGLTRVRFSLCRLVGLYLCLAAVINVVAQDRTTLTIDDLLRMEDIGTGSALDISISPDGSIVAFGRRRSRVSQSRSLYTGAGWDRADVWIAPVSGVASINITKGETDKTGFWNPVWSPDGRRLAMLSTRAGPGVSLWVWEKSTGKLAKTSEAALYYFQRPLWVDNEHLAVLLRPKEQVNEPEMGLGKAEKAAWAKAEAGVRASSALDSGGPFRDLTKDPQDRLVLIDVRTRNLRQLATLTGRIKVAGSVIKPAPDSRHVAIVKAVSRALPDASVLLRQFLEAEINYQLNVIDLNGHSSAKEINGVVLGSFQWAPDGRSFAFLGKPSEGDQMITVFRGTVDGSVDPVSGADWGKPSRLVWAGSDKLLVLAEHEVQDGGNSKNRLDWWTISATGIPHNLTETLESTPDDLHSVSADGQSLVGVASGDLWRIDVASGSWTNLTTAFDPKIASVVSPQTNRRVSDKAFISIIVTVRQGASTDYYWINSLTGTATKIARPSDTTSLSAYDSASDIGVFETNDSQGSILTLVQGGKQRTLVKSNTQLRDLAGGQFRKFAYRSLDGDELKGWLLLPAHYEVGKCYPLVTEVYAGRVMSDAPPSESQLRSQFSPFWNMQLLAARGYAVLFPSMPLKPEGQASDPYMELTKGVLPAIDRVIELGLADPKRLGVMGGSYGGYSTYSLITQTNRFQAAVAAMGITDLISIYGTFTPSVRYEENAQEHLSSLSFNETGQFRMGNPPWKDLSRYLRNSPIFYVDRVRTPLLMISGDQDFVPMEQAEEFFVALYRQRKRARLIRYWGEGHTLTKVEDLRDFWHQTYAWLDEFCDISRDLKGNLVFNGDKVKSRNGTAALKPEDFARFDQMELRSRPRASVSSER